MTSEHRLSLRWVELIVMVLIAVMLLALLVAYLNRNPFHGDRSMRAACMSNQKQFGLALLRYESRRGHFPGYRNYINDDVQGNPVVASWVVMLFPDLGMNPTWGLWNDPQVLAAEKPAGDWEALFRCPVDPAAKRRSAGPAALSYVVNCGKPGDLDTPAEGVFHDHSVKSGPVLVSVGYISQQDGTTYTLLLSENIQAGLWTDTDEANVGMVWRDAAGPCTRINECKEVGDRPGDLRYARPSSYHPGGVNVSFCDGRASFLNEAIDYEVYQHLMTPDGKEAGVRGEFDPADL